MHKTRSYCCRQYECLLASYCRLFVCLSVTPCSALMYHTSKVPEQVSRNCPTGKTILQRSTSYIDSIPSNSPPRTILWNFPYLLHRALLITWPFCLRWCELWKSVADGRVLVYDRLLLSNSWASCLFKRQNSFAKKNRREWIYDIHSISNG